MRTAHFSFRTQLLGIFLTGLSLGLTVGCTSKVASDESERSRGKELGNSENPSEVKAVEPGDARKTVEDLAIEKKAPESPEGESGVQGAVEPNEPATVEGPDPGEEPNKANTQESEENPLAKQPKETATEEKESEKEPPGEDLEKKEPLKEQKPKPVGPDGVEDPQGKVKMLPNFPPKDEETTPVLPEKNEPLDPRIAPDSDVGFNKDKIPLEVATGYDNIPFQVIPNALEFTLGKGGDCGSQRMRVEAKREITLKALKLQDPAGPFQLEEALQVPKSMKKGDAIVFSIACKNSKKVHETTLQILSEGNTIAIPVRLVATTF